MPYLNEMIPASVYSFDLSQVSKLAGISESDLVDGIRQKDAMEMRGVVVDGGEEVSFEAVGIAKDELAQKNNNFTPQAIRCALITATTISSKFGEVDLPRCLIPLGNQAIIVHVMEQLQLAGICNLVITIGRFGTKVVDVVKSCAVFSKLMVNFVNVGDTNSDTDARAILAARKLFKEPFLIQEGFHIFDQSIKSEIVSYQLSPGCDACIVIEDDVKGMKDMPSKVVEVRLDHLQRIIEIGEGLSEFDAIFTGLCVCSPKIFEMIETLLLTTTTNIGLADVLVSFIPQNRLDYIRTAGRTWFSLETEKQVASVHDASGRSVLSPWAVFIATASDAVDNSSSCLSASPGSMLIGVSPSKPESTLRVFAGPRIEKSSMFRGFVVNVNQAKAPVFTSATKNLLKTISSMAITRKTEEEAQLLPIEEGSRAPMPTQGFLAPITPQTNTLPRRKSFDPAARNRPSNIVRRGSVPKSFHSMHSHPYVLSIPLRQNKRDVGFNENGCEAYLIGIGEDDFFDKELRRFVLAVPDLQRLQRRMSIDGALLPTDITSVVVETNIKSNSDLEVQLVIKRQVPYIGFIILMLALVANASLGAVLALEVGISPLMKFFWRVSGTAVAFLPFAIYSIAAYGMDLPDLHLVGSMILCAAAWSYYNGAFMWALSRTSVGHAYLFANSHSLMIVLGKLITGSPIMLLEGIGACIGLLGGMVCTLDHSKDSAGGSGPSTIGDLVALTGAIGGVFYLTRASVLRSKLDIPVFMCALTTIASFCILIAMAAMGEPFSFSRHRHHGLVGWMNTDSSLFLIELYVVYIGGFVGTTGFISAMKYFQPLVVSVVMLTAPIIADILSIVIGVDGPPGLFTVVGASLVLSGTAIVIFSAQTKTQEIDITSAIHKTPSNDTASTQQSSQHDGYGAVAKS